MRVILRWISNHQRRQLSVSGVVVGKYSSLVSDNLLSLIDGVFCFEVLPPLLQDWCGMSVLWPWRPLGLFQFQFQSTSFVNNKATCWAWKIQILLLSSLSFRLRLFKWHDPNYISYSGNLPPITKFGVGPHCMFSCISFVCGAQHFWSFYCTYSLTPCACKLERIWNIVESLSVVSLGANITYLKSRTN